MALILPRKRQASLPQARHAVYSEPVPDDSVSGRSIPAPLSTFNRWSTRVAPVTKGVVPAGLSFQLIQTVLDLSLLIGDNDNKLIELGRISLFLGANVGGGSAVGSLYLQLIDKVQIDPSTGNPWIYDTWGTNIQGQSVALGPKNSLGYDWLLEALRADDFGDVNGGNGIKSSILQVTANVNNGTGGPVIFSLQTTAKYRVSQIG